MLRTGTIAAAIDFRKVPMKPAKRVKRGCGAAFMGVLEHDRVGVGKC